MKQIEIAYFHLYVVLNYDIADRPGMVSVELDPSRHWNVV